MSSRRSRLPRPDRLPGPGSEGLRVSEHLRRHLVIRLQRLSLVRAERSGALVEVLALRLLVHFEIEPILMEEGEDDPLPVDTPAAEHGPAGDPAQDRQLVEDTLSERLV